MMIWRSLFLAAVSAVLLVAIWPTASLAQDEPSADDLKAAFEARGMAWLLPADACAADVIGEKSVEADYTSPACEDNLGQCVAQCRDGDAQQCLGAAYIHEALENDDFADALFLRACEMGVVIACTNRAARLRYSGLGDATCNSRTFAVSCDRGDEFGCAMHGIMLSDAEEGVTPNLALAKERLARACELNDDSDGCDLARETLEVLEQRNAEE